MVNSEKTTYLNICNSGGMWKLGITKWKNYSPKNAPNMFQENVRSGYIEVMLNLLVDGGKRTIWSLPTRSRQIR